MADDKRGMTVDIIVGRMRFACWVTKATHTHTHTHTHKLTNSEYATLIPFSRQLITRARLLVL